MPTASSNVRLESAFRDKAENICSQRVFRLLTRLGHWDQFARIRAEPRRWVVEPPSHVSAATRRHAKDFEAASIPSAEAWALIATVWCFLGASQDPDMPNTYFGSGSQNEGQVGGFRFRIATSLRSGRTAMNAN